MRILKPTHVVFEALVDPEKISGYWWSRGSGRLEQGKAITFWYDEYNAQVDLTMVAVEANRQIVFRWPNGHTVTMRLQAIEPASTVVEVTEVGWDEADPGLIPALLDNKEGWVYMLTCLKAYLEFGVNRLRAGLAK